MALSFPNAVWTQINADFQDLLNYM